ncbi:MAG: AAA family ATPase [bacterium]
MSNASFDVSSGRVPDETVETRINVVAGGPCSGKSTLLEELESRGHHVEYEPAEQILQAEIEQGRSAEEVREDPIRWQKRVVQADFDLFSGLIDSGRVFTDTSPVESYVFSLQADLEIGGNLIQFLENVRFENVFFLESLDQHQTTEVRLEDSDTAQTLAKEIYQNYRRFDYKPQKIPAVSVPERVERVLDAL